MKKVFKKYFIPHEENEYRPHFLRKTGVFVLAFIIIFLFLASFFHATILTSTNFLATILPSVLVDLANEYRVVNNAQPLVFNSVLEDAARRKALDMATKEYFAHTSPEGITPWHWFGEAGYDFIYAGENLAVNFADSEDVNTAWINSAIHRANILNELFSEVGIATARGFYQGRETMFVVQMFGRPAPLRALNLETEAAVPVDLPEEVIVPGTVAGDVMFVAVKNPQWAEIDEAPKIISGVSSYASGWERLIASPKKTLQYFYMILAALIVLSLAAVFLVEVGRQHLLHIFYGFSLLLLMGFFIYAARAFVFPGSII